MLSIDVECICLSVALGPELAVDRIVFEQMRRTLGIAGCFVDPVKLDIFTTPASTKSQSSHAAKSIDPYFYGHPVITSIFKTDKFCLAIMTNK